jgi:hypothetical protein
MTPAITIEVFPERPPRPGAVAAAVTAAFATARDRRGELAPGGTLLFVVADEPVVLAAMTSLTRTLALEWAPEQVRVNAVRCPEPARAAGAACWLASAPAAMLTGAVLPAA